MKKKILLLLLFLPFLLAVVPSDKGRLIFYSPYETAGQKHWFVTPTGGGDCSSWNEACTFRTAVSRCTSTVQDVIWLGEGNHDTNNGSDGTGTTISVDGVSIRGMGSPWAANAKLINSHATASTVLTITGDGFNIDLVDFDQTGQTDVDVVYLNVNSSAEGSIINCRFKQPATATTGTGILFDNTSSEYHIEDTTFETVETYGIRTNGMTGIHAEHLHFEGDGIGVSIAGASDGYFCFRNATFANLSTGVSITGASVNNVAFTDIKIMHTTTSISSGGVWNGTHWQNVEVDNKAIKLYPATDGTAVATGDGAWTWTAAATTIIPASTITKPFYITGINVPTYDASQTYNIELFYGEVAASTSLGIYQFTVGTAGPVKVFVFLEDIARVAIPANSIVGAKLMSSTAGVDNITVTLSYEEI